MIQKSSALLYTLMYGPVVFNRFTDISVIIVHLHKYLPLFTVLYAYEICLYLFGRLSITI